MWIPPRSPKMKRRILGFQRRVWWPKWTPASSSSLMPTSVAKWLPCDVRWLCPPAGSRTRVDCAGQGRGRLSGGVGRGTCVRKDRAPEIKARRLGSRPAVYFSPRLALRRLAPVLLHRARDAVQRVVWTRNRRFPQYGMAKHQFRRVKELARQADLPPAHTAPVLRVAADRMADRREVRADLVGAAGLEPDAQQCRGGQPLDHLEAGDRRARAVAARRYHRAARAIAADRGVDRAARASGWPVTSARYSRRTSRAWISCLTSAAWASSVFATTSSPDVSRSSRCTMPARSGSGPPAARPRSASRERRSAVPRCRVGDQAGRLVDHHQVRVLVDDLEVGGRLGGSPGAGLALHLHHLARGHAVVLGTGCPVHQHRTLVDQPLGRRTRARGPVGREEGVEAQPGVLDGRL